MAGPPDSTYDDHLTSGYARGRGAQLNPPNRFEPVRLSVLGDYLDELQREHPKGQQVRTQVFRDEARTIINRVDSPDIPFQWTINPYRGCEHGCIYCYARPTHENFGLSCGLDFETKIFAKMDAPKLLRRELAHPKWSGGRIVMSGVTDPYQPIERTLKITRGCLEVMAAARQPMSIITKNHLVTRDIDYLQRLASHRAGHVVISLTTLDASLARRMEPRTSSPTSRLDAIRELSAAGVPVMVMTAPIIPGLNDTEIPALLSAARQAGAISAGYTLLHMPHQVKDVFMEWIGREFPDRAAKIESLIRATRNGALSDEAPGVRMRGTGAHAKQIRDLFRVHARKEGLNKPMPTSSSTAFRRPTVFDDELQMGLFRDSGERPIRAHPSPASSTQAATLWNSCPDR